MRKIIAILLFIVPIGLVAQSNRGFNNTSNDNTLLIKSGRVDTADVQAKTFVATGFTADIIPVGTTAQEPVGIPGMMRINKTTNKFRVVRQGSIFENVFTLEDALGATSGQVLSYNGSSWVPTTPTGGLSGSGSAGQIMYWSGTSSATGSAGMTYANNSIVINKSYTSTSQMNFTASGSNPGYGWINPSSRFALIGNYTTGTRLSLLYAAGSGDPSTELFTWSDNEVESKLTFRTPALTVLNGGIVAGQPPSILSTYHFSTTGTNLYRIQSTGGAASLVLHPSLANLNRRVWGLYAQYQEDGDLAILKGADSTVTSPNQPVARWDKLGKTFFYSSVYFNGPLMPNNLPGTNGQVLKSTGSSTVPVWGDNVSMREENFTATAAQTAFTIAYSAPAVSGTSVPVRVYRNGVRLFWVSSSPSITQFTYSGTTVTTAANASGDIITVEYLN